MAECRICFSVAGDFGIQMSYEAKESVPYDELAKCIDKEQLAKLLCLNEIGYSASDIEIITPEQYDEEFEEG